MLLLWIKIWNIPLSSAKKNSPFSWNPHIHITSHELIKTKYRFSLFLINTILTYELSTYLQISKQCKIFRLKSNSEIILCQCCFSCTVDILISSWPTLMTQNDSSIKSWTSSIRTNICFDMSFIMYIRRTKIRCFFPWKTEYFFFL
jgi:hypothetical protein